MLHIHAVYLESHDNRVTRTLMWLDFYSSKTTVLYFSLSVNAFFFLFEYTTSVQTFPHNMYVCDIYAPTWCTWLSCDQHHIWHLCTHMKHMTIMCPVSYVYDTYAPMIILWCIWLSCAQHHIWHLCSHMKHMTIMCPESCVLSDTSTHNPLPPHRPACNECYPRYHVCSTWKLQTQQARHTFLQTHITTNIITSQTGTNVHKIPPSPVLSTDRKSSSTMSDSI